MYTVTELKDRLEHLKAPELASKVQKYMDHVHNDYYRLALNLAEENKYQVRAVVGGKNIRIYVSNPDRRKDDLVLHSVIRRKGVRGDVVAVTKRGCISKTVVGNLFNRTFHWENYVTWRPLMR